MKRVAAPIVLLCSVLVLVSAPARAQLLQPSDLTYLGAFLFPEGATDEQSWAYGGMALTFFPGGDPGGDADGYPGSLYGVGHAWYQLASEVSIPVPVISATRDASELHRAGVLQGFADVTGGLRDASGIDPDYLRVGGLAYLPAQAGQSSAKLYWTLHHWYNVTGDDYLSAGWSELDLSLPQARGVWHIGPQDGPDDLFHTLKTSDYIFAIPDAWAAAWLDGKALMCGRHREAGAFGASQGPTLYAFAPWLDGVPAGTAPAHGSELAAEVLVYYPEGGGHFPDYRACDHWNGGVWLEAGGSEAVLIAGRKSLGAERYGAPAPSDCEQSQGYHCDPYEPQLLFYSPADLEQVLAGTLEPWQVVPYAVLRPDEFFWPTCHWELGGAAYDGDGGLLYVVQLEAAEFGEPLVHVFSVTGSVFRDGFESGDTAQWSVTIP